MSTVHTIQDLGPGGRLSTGVRRDINNISNNNLSTSASLLDATTADAMSSMKIFQMIYLIFMVA
jgi:hypothetical protein